MNHSLSPTTCHVSVLLPAYHLPTPRASQVGCSWESDEGSCSRKAQARPGWGSPVRRPGARPRSECLWFESWASGRSEAGQGSFGEREGFGTHPGVGVTEEVFTLLEALGSRSHGVGIRCQAESQFSLCPSMALGSHTTAAASPACLCLGSLCPWVPPIDSADAGICHRFLQAWALET